MPLKISEGEDFLPGVVALAQCPGGRRLRFGGRRELLLGQGGPHGLQGRIGWAGCEGERGREADWDARPRLGHAGVGETESDGRAELGFQLSFGPQPI
jgi:hypothetical protein